MRWMSLAPLLLVLVACDGTAPPNPEAIMQRFRDAGLAVNNVSADGALVPEVQQAAPSCVATRFDVAGEQGARVVVCGQEAHAQAVERYYVALGESSPLFFSHVVRRGGLVMQMSGSLPAETFAAYMAQLP